MEPESQKDQRLVGTFEIEWKDGTTSWIPLKELKEANPVEVAQYAADNSQLWYGGLHVI
jgi:hypothetical protein